MVRGVAKCHAMCCKMTSVINIRIEKFTMFLNSALYWMILVSVVVGVLNQEIPKLNPLSIPSHLTIESRAKLLCVASTGDQPIDFQWKKDGLPVSSGRIEQLDEWTSSLTINPLGLEHIGNYTCIATNSAGTDRVTASLFVTAPPQWIEEPTNLKVHLGEKAIFHCVAKGSPQVKITWKKKSESHQAILPVLPSDDFQIYENGSLFISKARKSKSGVYICEASNGVGNGLQKSAVLTVFEYPVVERVMDLVTAERGKKTHIACLARGDSPMSFSWLKNQKSLSDWPNDRLSYSHLPRSDSIEFIMSINSAQPEDEGLYSCVARNEYGTDQKDIRLMLVEHPKAPEFVELVDVWSRSARVRWSIPDNGNSPILSYTVEYWSTPGGDWNETVSSSLTSYIIRGLKPFTEYSLHVWASNSIGDSEPSEQIHFKTAKEEPSAAPVNVKIEDVGSTYIRLSWKPPPPEHWNGELSGYYVGYKQSTSKLPYTFNTVEAEEQLTYYVLRGLRRATRYLITVRAYNDIGSGPQSEEITVKTHNLEPPAQPVLMVKDIGSTYIHISWALDDEMRPFTTGFSIHYRKNGDKWQEISVPDADQTSYTLTNLDAGISYQIYVTSMGSTGLSEPSEIATVRTSAEAIFHAPPPTQMSSSVDDVTQILYIVVPVAVATVIIVIVIVTACVYVYSKRPLPSHHPYGDLPASKNFSYMSTVPRHHDIPITVCGGNAMKYGSPYSTVPLTRPEQEEEEPIYESVMDEIRCKIKQN
ncbi:Down syndrome cell adhesion molecule-like isoform X2 [Stegodyphus dumicola]|uniref:Down syndrome cell adhesion molecule-like isoform X2 n=1 Tax=Stegodyphus dumicola TaxID=202533 RepID=UPI0015AFFEA8|nr:Down syndrome cell adhesion molecule-like isoform X2 [Stegodyphus dumicola]